MQSIYDESNKELPENFYEKRRERENDNQICKLIRKDSIIDFITYINQNDIQSKSIINPSIYETNLFLIKNQKVQLIEYAAFCGSIQIFNYLQNNGAELTPLLWLYAIHSNNAELIQILEENKIIPKDATYEECFQIYTHNFYMMKKKIKKKFFTPHFIDQSQRMPFL